MTLIKRNLNTIDPDLETLGHMPTTFSEIMDEFFGRAFNNQATGVWHPELNVTESDNQFEIMVALPGINRDDVEVGLEDRTLIITGERKWKEDKNKKARLIESRFGKFQRTLPLPDTIDQDSVDAHLENGVLYITVKKLENKATKKIDIK